MPDAVYHVTSRGLERRVTVRNDQDRNKWLALLGEVAERRGWRVFAWALMKNHFHLFLRAPHADLSAGMHDLNSGYVTGFNRRHRRCGPLFQGRFKGIVVERDYHYWELSRYIHLNPVRAGLVASPEEYRWSSCRHYFRSRGVPAWLAWEEVLGQHGQTIRGARRAYRRFLMEGVSSPGRSPLDGVVSSTLLGSSAFIERMKRWLRGRLPEREVPAARALSKDVSLQDVVAAVCRAWGVSAELLTARGRHGNEARCAAAYLSRKLTRASGEEIGACFGGVKGSAVSHIVARATQRRRKDRRFRARLSRIERSLRQN